MKYISLILVALLALASCAGGNPQQPNPTVPFIGGNVGVEVGLIEGLPPASVYDNDRMKFAIGVALHNVGEADITMNDYAEVSLEGFSPRVFGLSVDQMSRELDQPLMGAQKNFDGTILPGQIANVVFEEMGYVDRLRGNIVQNLVISACYDYENYATANLCFKSDIFESVQDICSLTGEKFPQNSGGPIHVTSLVQNPLGPHRVMINFVVEHLGSGDFYGQESGETCDPSVTNLNKYDVDVSVFSENTDMQIDCSTLRDGGGSNNHTGRITLFSGAPTTVTCTLTGPENSGRIYTEPINIELAYRYGERITQPIVIQAVGDR